MNELMSDEAKSRGFEKWNINIRKVSNGYILSEKLKESVCTNLNDVMKAIKEIDENYKIIKLKE